jgi:hypothetical protein
MHMKRRPRPTGSEMSICEIALQLGISEQAACQYLVNGLRKLRERFPLRLRQMLDDSRAMRR